MPRNQHHFAKSKGKQADSILSSGVGTRGKGFCICHCFSLHTLRSYFVDKIDENTDRDQRWLLSSIGSLIRKLMSISQEIFGGLTCSAFLSLNMDEEADCSVSQLEG